MAEYIKIDAREAEEYAGRLTEEYHRRRRERVGFELQWQLSLNFFAGNQYCVASQELGTVYSRDKRYDWEEQEVFNHIAPIVETRIARLGRVRPSPVVRPATEEERDAECAKVSTAVLRAVSRKIGLSQMIENATLWAELCGTAFYKILWNSDAGRRFTVGGESVCEGETDISVCPPFEIYPDDAACTDIEDCISLIHARAVPKTEAEELWGEGLTGESVEVFSLECYPTGRMPSVNACRTAREGHVLVLERYERPSRRYPDGRLSINAGGKLVYDGPLPYVNKEDGQRGLPFVRQVCITKPNCFWGTSLVERCIPVQRAYNAIKNRKHEYIARSALGVLAVEEGAVDTTRLEDEGLEPGGIVVYRSGTPMPHFLETGAVPVALLDEENALLNEFILLSGVSDLARQSSLSTSNISGVALEILSGEDDTRLSITAEHMRSAVAQLSKQVLRLYRQFAVHGRLERIVGENGSVALMWWDASMLNSDDVSHETENELSQTVAERRKMVLDLLARGLFTNEQGRLDQREKLRILEMLGLGQWEDGQDIDSLHLERAKRENIALSKQMSVTVLPVDDHRIHAMQHTKAMLGEDFEQACIGDGTLAERFLAHVREHEEYLGQEQEEKKV